ncbi:hypothetical protein OH809_41195 [Streptomyces sp. NBC_00873]|uniref:hypothetical protein n=1 Tax=unclassified Streptomyces TaxID=2593676 RepID=UPI00386A4660|nr:hypothetical protein OH809_41195 [Streptomyces sp. NBC_00873]WTA41683.1 hypothetical protein OH821_02510 [Streptomyces sp. NBC_00842]
MDLPRPKWPLDEIAVIGGRREDDLAIAGGYLRLANRPDVLGSAHDLNRWLDGHPVK